MSLRYDFRVILRKSMDTSTTVMMIAATVTLVAIYWKSPAAASMVRFAVSFLFPFLAGGLCEMLWEKLHF